MVVIPFLPLYLIQALLVSIPLAIMRGGLLICLIWYVEGGERTGIRRALRKGFLGTTHFAAHVFTMFAAGLAFVMVNNWVAPQVAATHLPALALPGVPSHTVPAAQVTAAHTLAALHVPFAPSQN